MVEKEGSTILPSHKITPENQAVSKMTQDNKDYNLVSFPEGDGYPGEKRRLGTIIRKVMEVVKKR